MKKIAFFFAALFIANSMIAQSSDSISVIKIIELGTKGEIIHGKEIRKKQLNAEPQLLYFRKENSKEESTTKV
jgi:hypothetical protein